MRTLMSNEMEHVAGGDPIDGNQVACVTAVAAGGAIAGLTVGNSGAVTGGVLASPGVVTCQVITTSIGSAIGGAAADFADGFNELILDAEAAFAEMAMTLNRGTL